MKRHSDCEPEEGEVVSTSLPMTDIREKQLYAFKNFTARKRSPSPLYYEPVGKVELVDLLMKYLGNMDIIMDACDLCRRAHGRDVLWRALDTSTRPTGLRRVRRDAEVFVFLACVSIASKWYSRDNDPIFDTIASEIGVYYADEDVTSAEMFVLKSTDWVPFGVESLRTRPSRTARSC
jgi:hypothetical protein